MARDVLQVPWRAMLPVPRMEVAAWNTDLLSAAPAWRAAAGAAALALGVAIVWLRKVALALFGIGAAGLLAFAYVKYVGSMRHHGHLWLLLVAAIWMAGGLPRKPGGRTLRERAFVALLAIHAGATLLLSGQDLLHPFSNGARAAAVIRSQGLDPSGARSGSSYGELMSVKFGISPRRARA